MCFYFSFISFLKKSLSYPSRQIMSRTLLLNDTFWVLNLKWIINYTVLILVAQIFLTELQLPWCYHNFTWFDWYKPWGLHQRSLNSWIPICTYTMGDSSVSKTRDLAKINKNRIISTRQTAGSNALLRWFPNSLSSLSRNQPLLVLVANGANLNST